MQAGDTVWAALLDKVHSTNILSHQCLRQLSISAKTLVPSDIEPQIKVETAVQDTTAAISLDLTHCQRDHGKWRMWKSFAKYMRETYDSKES